MATSGQYSYSSNTSQIINAAFRGMNVYNDDSPPPQSDYNNALQALNLMLKSWMAQGYALHTVEQLNVPLVAGQIAYTIGPTGQVDTYRPLRVTYGMLSYNSGIDVPLTPLSRQEYFSLGNKGNNSVPNSYYYDPQTINGVLYLYLPATTSISDIASVLLTVQRPFQDVISTIDDFDFPIEWLNAIKYNLMVELSYDYTIPTEMFQRIAAKAKFELDNMWNFSIEDTGTFFTVDRRGWRR